MATAVDTLVVGAGISGLAYAHGLGPSADVHVLEAGDRVGGLIRTGEVDGVHFEWGPEALQDNAPETMALIDELGLDALPADESAKRRFILHDHGRPVEVPTGPGAFLRSPLLTLGGKLRAFSEPWRGRDGGLHGSLAEFTRHRLGPQVLERLVDPAVSGIYAGDPERISMRAAFPTLYDLVAEHGSILRGMIAKAKAKKRENGGKRPPRKTPSLLSVRGGLEAIPAGLAQSLGDRMHLGCRVSRVRRVAAAGGGVATGDRGPHGPGWLVEAAQGAWEARRVVLALPAGGAAGLLEQDEPALSQQLGSMVSEAVVSVAHVWPRESVVHALDGFGYLVPSRLGMTHLGTLFSSSLQPDRCPEGRVLLRTLLGGARRPELIDLDDAELLDVVRREVGGVLGLTGEPIWSRVIKWKTALPRYDLTQVTRQATIDALLAERPGLSIVGNHRRGISVNALIEASRALAREHRPAHA